MTTLPRVPVDGVVEVTGARGAIREELETVRGRSPEIADEMSALARWAGDALGRGTGWCST